MKDHLKIVVLALIYVGTARLGQILAIPPGNVTPVWIPSGIMLAALAIWGRQLWPGVFMGAFIGNAWAYFDPSSLSLALKGLLAATMNGTGDCLCVLIGLWGINSNRSSDAAYLRSSRNVLSFIFISAALGSLVSAVFGVGGLLLGGFAMFEDGFSIFSTWLLGDMMGVIIMFPLLIALKELVDEKMGHVFNFELLMFSGAFAFVLSSLVYPGLPWHNPVAWVFIIISMLLWSAFRFNWAVTPIVILVLSVTMITANVYGMGPFAHGDLNQGLLETQYYLLIASSTSLVVSADVSQRKKLFEENMALTEHLGDKVEEKTRELRMEVAHKNEIQRELVFQEQAFKQAQSLARMGHWRQDHINETLVWSDETYAIFEKPPKHYAPTYQGFLEAVHFEDRDRVATAYTNALEKGEPYYIEHRLQFRDGRIKHVLVNGLTKYDENGTPLHTLGTVQDITKEFQRKAELIEAKEHAEDANRAKMQFLSMMSHELRTPMNGVLGMAQLMEMEPNLSEDGKSFLKTIIQCGGDLLEILTSVLDFAKIDSGMQEIRMTVIDLNDLIGSVMSLFEGVAISKGIRLANEVDFPEIAHVYSDKDMLRRIFINLVGNAVKYTDTGSVKVEATLSDLSIDRVTLTLCVEDTGIGIPDDRIDRIFAAFEQADTTLSRRYGGTGLGLAISQSLTQLLGGTIRCESKEGKGSRFYVELPLELKPIQTATPSPGSCAPIFKFENAPLSGRVLVVEDDPDCLRLTLEILKRMSVRFDIARDGREALKKARETKYQLILMDLLLPELTGFDITRLIRLEDGPNTNTPIIALTALASKEDEMRCMDAGVTKVLTKPLILADLTKAVEANLKAKTS
ncbi:MAG: MASE1 domain-containing protein [Coraliomargarita sp.]